MPPVTNKKIELDDVDIAVALMRGGLSWGETIAVMNHISFDKSSWNGVNVVKISNEQN